MSQLITRFAITPNPNNGVFTLIAITENALTVNMMIVDMQGRIMLKYQWDLVAGRNALPIEKRQWPAGVYLLALSQGDTRLITARFMIMHN